MDVRTELSLHGRVSGPPPPTRLSSRLVCASAEWKMNLHGAESLDRH